jgi:hypothetical protein
VRNSQSMNRRGGKDLEVVDVADFLAGVEVDPDGAHGLIPLELWLYPMVRLAQQLRQHSVHPTLRARPVGLRSLDQTG